MNLTGRTEHSISITLSRRNLLTLLKCLDMAVAQPFSSVG